MTIEILSQFLDLQNNYRKLKLEALNSGQYFIIGMLEFEAVYNNISIQDAFEIEIRIESDYPKRLPSVKETGGKIPKEFHTNHDGFLCLGSSLAIKETFKKNPNLTGFVENVTIPFFYSFCYWEKFKTMPFGELPHGIAGVLWDYKERFSNQNELAVMGFLKILAEKSYRGHVLCPCESGKRLRDCHGKLLLAMQSIQDQEDFLLDYANCHEYLVKTKGINLPSLKTPRLMSFIKTIASRNKQ